MSTNAYIDTLKSEVELLRNELEGQRELLSRELEDWKEEARRKDAIIMSLTQRIPELQAPQDTPSETRESPQMAPEEPSDTHAPPEEERRSWWQRLFGV